MLDNPKKKRVLVEKSIMTCVLCDSNFVKSYNFCSTDTIHSKTSVKEFCKKIFGEDLEDTYGENELICENCYEIINELDLMEKKSKELITDMKRRYNSKLQPQENIIVTSHDKSEIYTVISLSSTSKERQDSETNDGNIDEFRSSSPETEDPLQHNNTSIEKIHFNNENDLKTILEGKYKMKEVLNNWEASIGEDDQDVHVLYDMMDEKNIEILVEPKKVDQPKNPLQCEKCSEIFESKDELKLHKVKHNNDKPYICEICGKVYRNKTALHIHVGMHKGVNPFKCVYCNKTFTQKGALIRHVKIHTGEKPFQCDECGKCFTHHTSFNIHKISHSGKKDYKCEVCGLALNSTSHLKRHMRVHTGEKRHICPICGKRFAEKYNLVTHVKLHNGQGRHKKKTFRCVECGQIYKNRDELEDHYLNVHSLEDSGSYIFISSPKKESVE